MSLRVAKVPGSKWRLKVDPGRGQVRDIPVGESPYLAESVHGERTDCYRHEMKTEPEHAEKLAVLLEHPGPVLSCGYRTKLYDDMLLGAGWSLLEARAYAEHGNLRVEAMYINPIAADAQRQQLNLGVA